MVCDTNQSLTQTDLCIIFGLQHKPIYSSDSIAMATDARDIRFLTSNFILLQGLRWVPFGLFMILEGLSAYDWALWESTTGGRLGNGFNKWILIVLIAMFVGVHWYYQLHFGHVVEKPAGKKGALKNAGFVILFVLAIYIQIAFSLKVYSIALVLGIMMIIPSLQLGRLYGPAFAGAVMVLYSFWPQFSAAPPPLYQFYLICVMLYVVSGIYTHFQFAKRFKLVRQSINVDQPFRFPN